MSNKAWRFNCEYCGFRKTVLKLDDCGLREHKLTAVPGGVPTFDRTTKIFTNKKTQERPRKFKCPQCGRLVGATKVNDVQAISDDKKRQEELNNRRKIEREEADKLDAITQRLIDSKGVK